MFLFIRLRSNFIYLRHIAPSRPPRCDNTANGFFKPLKIIGLQCLKIKPHKIWMKSGKCSQKMSGSGLLGRSSELESHPELHSKMGVLAEVVLIED